MKKNLRQVIALSFVLLSFGALAFAGEIKGKVDGPRYAVGARHRRLC